VTGFIAIGLFAGFTTGKMNVSHPYTGGPLPRPKRILVYDFSSDARDLSASSSIRERINGAGVRPEHVSVGRELGVRIATDLSAKIKEMGLPAMRVSAQAAPRAGDIVFKGYFLSADEGDAAKRMALGFGSGGAELTVKVEAYQMTAKGLRFLGSGEGTAETGKSPGTAVGIGTTIATSNPVGLIVGGALKANGEASGKETIDGAASKIAKLIAVKLEAAFRRQGWI